MKHRCPVPADINVALSVNPSPKSGPVVRFGRYYRTSDARWIQRYRCRTCSRYFSSATGSRRFDQRKRRVNEPLRLLLCSGVSQRRAAVLLRVNRKTVVRKFRWLAEQARTENERRRLRSRLPLKSIQFDDLETSEHSKCKPLSVALAVDANTREILAFQVSQMPAKGLLARMALQKYGPRKDERAKGWRALMQDLGPVVDQAACIRSDENPHYLRFVKRAFPEATHETVKGRRGCVAGQGELKKIGFDPLFALNHTCAMLRANLNRLFRRTWCTTKKRDALRDHIAIYVQFHNRTVLSGIAAA